MSSPEFAFQGVMTRNHFLPTLLMTTRQNANNLVFASMSATIGFESLCALTGAGRNLGLKKRFQAFKRGEDIDDCLVVLQYPPVYALGTRNSNGFLSFDLENPLLTSIEQSVEECYADLYVPSKDLMEGLEKRLL